MANISSEVISLAQQTEAKYGVPASVTIAQYGMESGWGSSNLAAKGNNYFGITGKNKNTGKYVMMNGRSWAAYGSMEESFYDHGRLLSTDLYSNAHKNTKDPYQYIDAIAEIYAPSSDGNNGYAATLKQIIADNNLTQYDGAGVSVPSGSPNSSYYVGGSSDNGGMVYGGSSGGAVVVDNEASTIALIVGKIIKFIVIVAVGFMACVFFFSAFDISNPLKKVGAKRE